MAIVAIGVLGSCTNDSEATSAEDGKGDDGVQVFTAVVEGIGSRATINDLTPSWNNGDKIDINGKTFKAKTGGATAEFEPLNYLEKTSAPYVAYFPTEIVSISGTPHLPNLYAVSWSDGLFDMPMYASSNTNDLVFKNLCGVLKIIVKSDQIASVSRIRVSSANCALSGDFTIENNAAKLKNPTDATKGVEILLKSDVPIDAAGKAFYVPLPPQTYRGLKIELDPDDKGYVKSMTTKVDADVVIERNKLYTITFADNTPATTGTAKANINGELVDVKWVQLWEGGPKFAEYNVGVTDGKPESYGGLYRWGSHIDTDTSADAYYNTGNADLAGDDDTATFLWGSNWRMPTRAELWLLVNAASDKCRGSNATVNGVSVRKITGGKDYFKNNSIILPRAGQLNYSNGEIQFRESSGYYWSASYYQDGKPACITFGTSGSGSGDTRNRKYGFSVRAVLVE